MARGEGRHQRRVSMKMATTAPREGRRLAWWIERHSDLVPKLPAGASVSPPRGAAAHHAAGEIEREGGKGGDANAMEGIKWSWVVGGVRDCGCAQG
jgi:hypothetical protein